jgi:transposase InsO family protein
MTWKARSTVDERVRFIEAVHRGEDDVSSLCRQFGVSRKTAYKWIGRAERGEALTDRSRAPLSCPHATAARVQDVILEARHRHPTWGPRKLLAWLARKQPKLELPAASTVGELLKRSGLVLPRKLRRRCDPNVAPLATIDDANAVWCADFKGAFKTGDQRTVNALTITDGFSRYLLRCRAMTLTHTELVQRVYDSVFREFGLPLVFRTDNGPPFAGMGPKGLSKLSVWLLKLGVRPERIAPGKPTQNGRHERMHRTLKEDTASPPAKTFAQQQRRFDLFRKTYNEERPHQALENRTPASIYTTSPRRYPMRLIEFEYSEGFELRRVRHNGEIKWGGGLTYVCESLAGEMVGLEPRDDGTLGLFFGSLRLGGLDEEGRFDRTLLDP